MKYTIYLILAVVAVLVMTAETYAQAIYGPQGQYLGYSQTYQSGVTTVYDKVGREVQSYQVDNGQTNFYSPAGRYQGTVTSPTYNLPNTMLDSPRQVPQARSVGGW